MASVGAVETEDPVVSPKFDAGRLPARIGAREGADRFVEIQRQRGSIGLQIEREVAEYLATKYGIVKEKVEQAA